LKGSGERGEGVLVVVVVVKMDMEAWERERGGGGRAGPGGGGGRVQLACSLRNAPAPSPRVAHCTRVTISGAASQPRMRAAASAPCCRPASRSEEAVMLYIGGGAYGLGPPSPSGGAASYGGAGTGGCRCEPGAGGAVERARAPFASSVVIGQLRWFGWPQIGGLQNGGHELHSRLPAGQAGGACRCEPGAGGAKEARAAGGGSAAGRARRSPGAAAPICSAR
jgi:hypothetical protein